MKVEDVQRGGGPERAPVEHGEGGGGGEREPFSRNFPASTAGGRGRAFPALSAPGLPRPLGGGVGQGVGERSGGGAGGGGGGGGAVLGPWGSHTLHTAALDR